MNQEQQIKEADEKYCESCGQLIKIKAEICPHCGVRQKNKVSKVALVLITFFLGGLGGHKFYTRQYLWGGVYFLFFWTGIPAIVALIEFIIYLFTSEERLQEKYDSAGGGIALIVIACLFGLIMVMGILAAIAIPNFIAFRNKAYCSQVESDAYMVLSTLADYYSDPAHERIPTIKELEQDYGLTLSNPDVRITGQLPDLCVIVKDNSGRCPDGDRYIECFNSPGRWE